MIININTYGIRYGKEGGVAKQTVWESRINQKACAP